MAVTQSIQEYLRISDVPYTVFPHAVAFTAQEEAAVTHTHGRGWAKVVSCFVDREPVLVVIPADRMVDFESLLRFTGADTVQLAREEEFGWLFPDCELGAMPPFGPLYGQRVFVDSLLASEKEIAFNGGTHHDAIRMRYRDFASLVRPRVCPLSRARPLQGHAA